MEVCEECNWWCAEGCDSVMCASMEGCVMECRGVCVRWRSVNGGRYVKRGIVVECRGACVSVEGREVMWRCTYGGCVGRGVGRCVWRCTCVVCHV